MGWRLQIVGSEPHKKFIFFGPGGAFSWVGGCKSSVLDTTTKNDFEFFLGPGGGVLVGGDRGGSWGRGGREVEGSGGGSGGGQGRRDRGKS